jgi:hypothetical protein
VITRITSAMSPRVCRVCALGVPTTEERSQWYFQRYVKHLPRSVPPSPHVPALALSTHIPPTFHPPPPLPSMCRYATPRPLLAPCPIPEHSVWENWVAAGAARASGITEGLGLGLVGATAPAKSCSSTARGTTAPGWSAS